MIERAQNPKSSPIFPDKDLEQTARAIAATLNEPVLLLDQEYRILACNPSFSQCFDVSENVLHLDIFDAEIENFKSEKLHELFSDKLQEKDGVNNFEVGSSEFSVKVNASKIDQRKGRFLFLLSFKVDSAKKNTTDTQASYKKLLNEILSQAPAVLCTLRGPEHVFELANDNYLQLVGHRDIIGKTVKEALPEVENQGFIEILDKVYKTGKSFVGNEVPVKIYRGNKLENSLVDFVFQPTRNSRQEVDGIFVHAIDVSERVLNRKKLEEREIELRNLIDAVPVIIRISDKDAQSSYLNKNWYDYTGQQEEQGLQSGWMEAIHPEDRARAEKDFRSAVSEEKEYRITYRLRAADGEYRCMLDRSRPKYSAEGDFEGMVSSIVDVHEDKLKEKVIREKEHRIRSIVEEATVATAVYIGRDMRIDLANDAMIELWGKDRRVLGEKLEDALPELEGQPFHDLLQQVYSTGETYWGHEDKVDLVIDGKLQTGYFNFTYKPLRNENGEIYGILNMAVDVSEIVDSKHLLKEREEYFRSLIDLMPGVVWITDAEGRNVFVNQNWPELTGQELDAAKNLNWIDLVHEDEREKVRKIYKAAIEKKENYSSSFRMRHKDGGYHWVMDKGRANIDKNGNFQGFVGSITDIHEEKSKDLIIREKEHRLRSIVEEATVATGVYSGRDMKIDIANDVMLEMWGKDRSVIGKTFEEAIPELEGQPFLGYLQEVYDTGVTYWGREEKADLIIDGKLTTGYFNYTYKALRDKSGKIYGILHMAIDVTEIVESKNLLRESESHYRQMADLMPEKVTNTDPAGKAVYFNQNWLDYSGMSSEHLRQEGWIDLIHPEDKVKFAKKWRESLSDGSHFETEVRIRNKEGAYLWHLSRAEAVRDEDGLISMWISTNTEIQKLKEEEKRKEDFLKMVSHELKTPVTSMKGYVQLLLTVLERTTNEELLDMPFKPSLERIDHQIVRLTRLISEMLDLSRIEEGKLELQKKRFSINGLVEDTVQDIILTNTQHKIDISHHVKAEVCADKDRIGQVLINLITNAIKYSPESNHIEILIEPAREKEIAVRVRDRGIGIEEKYQKNIFKRFYRIGIESEETYSGFGIGLYLANEIMQRHDGRIEVKSEIGQGSEFSLVLAEAPKKE